MISLTPNIASAFRSLRGSALRSALTALGVATGVASVVLLIALGEGVQQDVGRELDRIGTNLVVVLPGKLEANQTPNLMSLIALTTLTERDARDLSRLPGIAECMPLMILAGSVERGGRSYPIPVVACTSTAPALRPIKVVEGRFFRPDEGNQRVCVLAHEPRRQVFGSEPALGRTLSVRGVSYRVIGVLGPDPPSLISAGSFSFFSVIYTPMEAARAAFGDIQVNRIFIKTDPRADPEPVLASLRRTLLRNHEGREDFGVLTQEQLLGAVFRVSAIVTALLAGISAISLAVAGLGVMNIMLVVVTERTREIGIRKTVGARWRDVFLQFLTEAVVLCLVGGVVGVGLAAALCAVVAARTPLQPVITGTAIAMAFGVCLVVGVLFGVAPALRAARQSPIEALRWE